MAIECLELVSRASARTELAFLESQGVYCTYATRYFSVSGLETLADNLPDWTTAALSPAAIPKVGSIYTIQTQRYTANILVKRVTPMPTQGEGGPDGDPTIATVVVEGDDYPYPGFMPLHGLWESSTRQMVRQTYVDADGNKIVVVSPNSANIGLNIAAAFKPASVPQFLTQDLWTRTQYLTEAQFQTGMRARGKTNDGDYLGYPAGMLLAVGAQMKYVYVPQPADDGGTPVLGRVGVEQNRLVTLSSDRILMATYQVLSAGPQDITTTTMSPNELKLGWEGLGYYTETGIERIPLPIKTIRNDGKIDNVAAGGNEVIVKLYQDFDFAVMGPSTFTTLAN